MKRLILIAIGVLVASGASRAGTPALCLPGDPGSFNPQLASDESTRLATRPIYDHLIEVRATRTGRGPATIALEPGLAESWEVSHNGRVYTFQLRRGVRFQKTAYFTPSRLFNADDVLFSFNRQRLSAHPFHPVGGGTYPDFGASGLPKNLAQVEKLNDHAVRFHLNQPDPDFLAKLSQDGAAILSAEYGETLLAKGTAWEIDQLPVGTGAFALQKYERGQTVIYTPNPNYFRGRPAAPLRFAIVATTAARDAKVRAGQCAASGFQFP